MAPVNVPWSFHVSCPFLATGPVDWSVHFSWSYHCPCPSVPTKFAPWPMSFSPGPVIVAFFALPWHLSWSIGTASAPLKIPSCIMSLLWPRPNCPILLSLSCPGPPISPSSTMAPVHVPVPVSPLSRQQCTQETQGPRPTCPNIANIHLVLHCTSLDSTAFNYTALNCSELPCIDVL